MKRHSVACNIVRRIVCKRKENHQGSLDLMSRRDRDLKMENLVGNDETTERHLTHRAHTSRRRQG